MFIVHLIIVSHLDLGIREGLHGGGIFEWRDTVDVGVYQAGNKSLA
jgi:hypothetical protein